MWWRRCCCCCDQNLLTIDAVAGQSTTPTITGMVAEEGAPVTVTVFDGDTPIFGPAVATTVGNDWSITTTTLPIGDYTTLAEANVNGEDTEARSTLRVLPPLP